MKDILSFLTSLPGILILCGVVLLIISMILFIVGNKKAKTVAVVTDKKEEKEKPVEAPVEKTEVAPIEEVKVEEPKVVEEKVEKEHKIYEFPAMEEKKEVAAPKEASVEIPSVVPVVETPIEHTVYGGNTPSYDFKINEEKPVSIYGGNDPLEKTQSLPKVEEHHAPYGGAIEQPVEEPVIEEKKHRIYEFPPLESMMAATKAPEESVVTTPVEEPKKNVYEFAVNEPKVETPVVKEPEITIPAFEPVQPAEIKIEAPASNNDEVEELL